MMCPRCGYPVRATQPSFPASTKKTKYDRKNIKQIGIAKRLASSSAGELCRSENEGPIGSVTSHHGTFQAIGETVGDLTSRFYRGMLVSLPVQAKRPGEQTAPGRARKRRGKGRVPTFVRALSSGFRFQLQLTPCRRPIC